MFTEDFSEDDSDKKFSHHADRNTYCRVSRWSEHNSREIKKNDNQKVRRGLAPVCRVNLTRTGRDLFAVF